MLALVAICKEGKKGQFRNARRGEWGTHSGPKEVIMLPSWLYPPASSSSSSGAVWPDELPNRGGCSPLARFPSFSLTGESVTIGFDDPPTPRCCDVEADDSDSVLSSKESSSPKSISFICSRRLSISALRRCFGLWRPNRLDPASAFFVHATGVAGAEAG